MTGLEQLEAAEFERVEKRAEEIREGMQQACGMSAPSDSALWDWMIAKMAIAELRHEIVCEALRDLIDKLSSPKPDYKLMMAKFRKDPADQQREEAVQADA